MEKSSDLAICHGKKENKVVSQLQPQLLNGGKKNAGLNVRFRCPVKPVEKLTDFTFSLLPTTICGKKSMKTQTPNVCWDYTLVTSSGQTTKNKIEFTLP